MTATALAGARWRWLRLTRIDVAIVVFTVPAVLMAWGLAVAHGRPLALVVILPCLAAVGLRTRPLLAASCLGAGATLLRLSYLGIGSSTQIDNARAAAERAFGGLSPYGVTIPSASGPPEPFVYGPLALLWWQPGVVVELAASVAVTALLIGTRSWLTLALYSGLPFSIYLAATGVNDYSPGLVIAGALLLARTHAVARSLLLAIAAAIKPYAFAWFMPVVGLGGWQAAAALASLTAVLWSPLAVWGPGGFLRSVELANGMHPESANTLNLPVFQWLAMPLALGGLFANRWEWAVLAGSAAFVAFLFLGQWASLGYWLAVIPVAGIALERLWTSRRDTP